VKLTKKNRYLTTSQEQKLKQVQQAIERLQDPITTQYLKNPVILDSKGVKIFDKYTLQNLDKKINPFTSEKLPQKIRVNEVLKLSNKLKLIELMKKIKELRSLSTLQRIKSKYSVDHKHNIQEIRTLQAPHYQQSTDDELELLKKTLHSIKKGLWRTNPRLAKFYNFRIKIIDDLLKKKKK
jgi:hypothetical protein